jgi:large subunit ribosomal protein L18
MATGPRYTVKFRRRREGKTNYHTRLGLLTSRKPRLVVRKTNKYITCQIISYVADGDKVLASAHSKQLIKLGWKHSCNNISAAYLTGLLVGASAKKAKVSEVIFDMGLYSSTKGSVIYATLKGAVDSGVVIPHNTKIFPTEERINGSHTKSKDLLKDVEAIKKKIGGGKDATKKSKK